MRDDKQDAGFAQRRHRRNGRLGHGPDDNPIGGGRKHGTHDAAFPKRRNLRENAGPPHVEARAQKKNSVQNEDEGRIAGGRSRDPPAQAIHNRIGGNEAGCDKGKE